MPRLPAPAAFALLAATLTVAVAASAEFGTITLSWADWRALATGEADDTIVNIVVNVRLPRVALAALVGAALGASGAAYQALFRNPLADPFLIGSSSGAAFGVAAVLLMGWRGQSAGAFAGSAGAVAVVYAVARIARLETAGFLLAGAAVSSMLSGSVWLAMVAGDRQGEIIGFLMGGLNGHGAPDLERAAAPILVSVAILSCFGRTLDALTLGDEPARALGVHWGRVVAAVLILTSIATSSAVAAGGVVGFVGLVAPHLARPLVGGTHARLVPASAVTGATLVTAADLLARTAVAPGELPLGVLTSFLGGPFFLLVLIRAARRRTL